MASSDLAVVMSTRNQVYRIEGTLGCKAERSFRAGSGEPRVQLQFGRGDVDVFESHFVHEVKTEARPWNLDGKLNQVKIGS